MALGTETIQQAVERVTNRTLEIQQRPEAQTYREWLRNHDDLVMNRECSERVAQRAADILVRRHGVGVTNADLIMQRVQQDPLFMDAVVLPRILNDFVQTQQQQQCSRLVRRISSLPV